MFASHQPYDTEEELGYISEQPPPPPLRPHRVTDSEPTPTTRFDASYTAHPYSPLSVPTDIPRQSTNSDYHFPSSPPLPPSLFRSPSSPPPLPPSSSRRPTSPIAEAPEPIGPRHARSFEGQPLRTSQQTAEYTRSATTSPSVIPGSAFPAVPGSRGGLGGGAKAFGGPKISRSVDGVGAFNGGGGGGGNPGSVGASRSHGSNRTVVGASRGEDDEVPTLPTHLPSLKKGSDDPTSLTNWDVTNELEYAIGKIIGEHVLHDMMSDKEAQRRFREYLASQAQAGITSSSPVLLDLYNDLLVFAHLASLVRHACTSIQLSYLTKTSPHRLSLPISIRGRVLESLITSSEVGLSLQTPLREILNELYNGSFTGFMQVKLVEHAVEKLGSRRWGKTEGFDGLGDAYIVTNPRLRDDPIVLASEGFSALTGYPIDMIVGRNCRFLQGPGTAPDSVTWIREALSRGEPITSLLLNYKASGGPFFNLLFEFCMLPLRDAHGTLRYFIGGQVDCTGNIEELARNPLSLAGSPTTLAGETSLTTTTTDDEEDEERRGAGGRELRFTGSVQKSFDGLLRGDEERARKMSGGGMGLSEGGGGQARATTTTQALDFGAGGAPTLHIRKESGASSMKPSSASSVQGGGVRSGGSSSAGGSTRERVLDGLAGLKARTMGRLGKSGELGMSKEEHERGREGAEEERERLMSSKLTEFQQTYSRVILIRQSNREILFCTPELVTFCGLPATASNDLPGIDFVKILFACEPPPPPSSPPNPPLQDKSRLRRNIKLAIAQGHSFAVPVGLRPYIKSRMFARARHLDEVSPVECVLHLTPLCNKDGQVEAFVAVFG